MRLGFCSTWGNRLTGLERAANRGMGRAPGLHAIWEKGVCSEALNSRSKSAMLVMSNRLKLRA